MESLFVLGKSLGDGEQRGLQDGNTCQDFEEGRTRNRMGGEDLRVVWHALPFSQCCKKCMKYQVPPNKIEVPK